MNAPPLCPVQNNQTVFSVPRATGIEMLNEAVDRLLSEVGRERWSLVDVHISPSAIAIFEARAPQRQIASCRVRYLSFLGVGRDVKFVLLLGNPHSLII